MSTATLAAPNNLIVSLYHFVNHVRTKASLPASWTVERATREIASAIDLPESNVESGRQTYELFRRREDSTERLNPSSQVGDVIQEGDEIEAMPEIVPGRV